MTRRCYLCDRNFEAPAAQTTTTCTTVYIEEEGAAPICHRCRFALLDPIPDAK
jgi:hypothetical protein